MTRMGIVTVLIFSIFWSHTNAQQKCNISMREARSMSFPDLWKYTELSYELSVEYSLPNEDQYDFAKEYYDKSSTIGLVEYYTNGKKLINFYNKLANEGFNIKEDGKCESMEAVGIPAYQKNLMTEDWIYQVEGQPLVMGPSAMLLHAQAAFQNDPNNKKTAYMGKTKQRIRGINAQYWRRCSDGFRFDYYFSTADKMNAYNMDIMNTAPLRVEIYSEDENDKKYPQIYDIIKFQPYISDRTKLEPPIGYGCKLGEDADIPTMPDFTNKNLITFGEAIYKEYTENATYDYMSTFMIAMSVNTEHLAYYYTPWSKATRSKKTEAAGYKHMLYDMRNKYLYTNDLFNDKCTVTREKSFVPSYVLPTGNGYIGMTDGILFPDSNFEYIADSVDRNMEVHTYEAALNEGYFLGNTTVPKAIITRNYLKDNTEMENTVGVKNALTSINIDLYNDQGKKTSTVTFNFFGFSTKLEYEEQLFDIRQCFKKFEDSLWVKMGFEADPAVMRKIEQVLPSVEINFRKAIGRISELNSMRMPTVLVDFGDNLYITFMILDKPDIRFDYLEPEMDTTLVSDETEGMKGFDGCARDCLESEDNCWGFSVCGLTCYFGIGNKKTTKKNGCEFFGRYDNNTYLNSKEKIRDNLYKLVETGQFTLSIRTEGDEKPVDLQAKYFESDSLAEDSGIIDLVGMETSPRLRVVKAGAKLDPKAGENMKHFGDIAYDECQRLCLDYQACETVSYCLGGPCVLSLTYGEEIPKNQILEDSFCNLLTRKYGDQFVESPGLVLSQSARKTLETNSVEECAKACARETSFDCRSFDNCPASGKADTCRLHEIHYLDLQISEKTVSKELTCGHYSRKFSYDFRRESNKRVTNAVNIAATNLTLEQCAKLCSEYADGFCHGYDYCEDRSLTSSSCTLLEMAPADMKTVYSPICNHFLIRTYAAPEVYSKSTAAWVGILCFVISLIVGVGLTFGIGYWRANRAI